MSAATPQPQPFIVVATGLVAEARIAARSRCVRAVSGGGDAARLEALLAEAAGPGCAGILSFGLAGGLQRTLSSGTAVIAREVVGDGKRYKTDAAWSARLDTLLRPAVTGTIAGVDHPVVTAAAKQALHEATGAAAADMESHVAARIAERRGVPFAVLRVVADPAACTLPGAALAGMRRDGTMDTLAVVRALLANPSEIPAILHVARHARRAFAELLRCHRLLGEGLGLFDVR